jgi:RNA polymerase sigma-70 factor (ECF subfamily)
MMKDDRRSQEKREAPSREKLFEEIYDEFFSRIVKFFLQRGLSRDESLDLAQETFFNVYRGIEYYQKDKEISPWVLSIASNVWRNANRYRNSHKRRGAEVSLDEVTVDEYTQGSWRLEANELENLLEDEKRRKLYEAIEKMPQRMRQCLLLRVHAGLKYREIAEVMNVSIGTVKAMISQVKDILERELGDYYSSFDV